MYIYPYVHTSDIKEHIYSTISLLCMYFDKQERENVRGMNRYTYISNSIIAYTYIYRRYTGIYIRERREKQTPR